MILREISLAALLCAGVSLTACGGGGSGAVPSPIFRPTSAPIVGPTTAPVSGPSPTSHGRAIAASIGRAGQILPQTAGRQSLGRRALGTTVRGIPTIVEAFGDAGITTGVDVWEYDTTTLAPVADGTPSIVNPDGDTSVLPISPVTTSGFTDAFTASIEPAAVALSSVNVTFASAAGSIPVYIYAGAELPCPAAAWVGYSIVAGALVRQTAASASDFSVDCTNVSNPVVTFRLGAQVDGTEVADAYGSVYTAFTTVLTAPAVTTSVATSFAQNTTAQGQIVIFKTADGPLAKFMFTADPTGQAPLTGIVAEANALGNFAY